MTDIDFMQRALALARTAHAQGEVPVGAVLVADGIIIGEGFNTPISNCDVSAHAEIQCLRQACKNKENYRLPGTTLFVTVEPCAMCAGAIVHARVARVVIATTEPRAGAAGSALNVLQNTKLNHQCELEFGVLRDESRALIQQFFRARRES